jgi:predicted transcriptional regulator
MKISEEDILEYVKKNKKTSIYKMSKDFNLSYLTLWIKVNMLIAKGKLKRDEDGKICLAK